MSLLAIRQKPIHRGRVPTPGGMVYAASASQADVASAVAAANAGDTVSVPAGEATWASPITIDAKHVAVVGAGIGNTTITGGRLFTVTGCTNTNFVRISGFTLVKGSADLGGMVNIATASPWNTVGFRVDHCRFWDNGVAGGRGIMPTGYGLIDHCDFDIDDTTASDQMISPHGTPTGSDGGHTAWTYPLSMGSDKACYVEDCTFTCANQREDVIDAYGGARLVIRHNTFTDTSVGFHGTDSGGERSPVSVELYSNVFTNGSVNRKRASTNRGGTALYFDNTYSGAAGWYRFALVYYRASTTGSAYWGHACDGTPRDLGSAVLSSDLSRTTVAADTGVRFLASNPDTISAVGTRYFDGDGTSGYPGRDQPGRGPNGQTLSPVYAWANNGGTASPVVEVDPGLTYDPAASTWMAENRDFYNFVSSGFDGSVGVGQGLLAARPASGLTAGVGYWATDESKLYVATDATTWAEYYAPYTYPHPLAT